MTIHVTCLALVRENCTLLIVPPTENLPLPFSRLSLLPMSHSIAIPIYHHIAPHSAPCSAVFVPCAAHLKSTPRRWCPRFCEQLVPACRQHRPPAPARAPAPIQYASVNHGKHTRLWYNLEPHCEQLSFHPIDRLPLASSTSTSADTVCKCQAGKHN